MPWYLLFSGNFFIIQTFYALIDRTGKGLYWNFFCQLLKPFSQSSIHEVVPFHHPKAKGTLLYKVLVGFWPVAWQKLKAQMLGWQDPFLPQKCYRSLFFPALVVGSCLTVMLGSSKLEDKGGGLEIKIELCWRNHEKIGPGVPKQYRPGRWILPENIAKSDLELQQLLRVRLRPPWWDCAGAWKQKDEKCFLQFGVGEGELAEHWQLSSSSIIVHLCKVNSVEDEAVGKHSEILPSIAEYDLRTKVW